MVNFGPLAAEIVSLVWCTPGNFNGFRVLAALLHGTIVGRQPNCGVEQRAPLYSAGRPSRWALAHILVKICSGSFGTCLSCLSVTLVHCGQTVGWIKMKLGMEEVCLGAGHIVFDGDPAPCPQKGQSPQFLPMSVVAKRLDGSGCHLVGRSALAKATWC